MPWQSKIPGLTEKVLDLYPTMSSREIHEATGFAKSSIIRCARKNNLKHTEEAQARINAYVYNRRQEGLKKRDLSKLGEKIKTIRRIESWRVRSGMRKETKYKVCITPKKVQQAMFHLARKHNYFYDTVDDAIMYYDSQTRRTKREQYFVNKYGIRFEQADEE